MDLKNATTSELLATYAAILEELLVRKVVRTRNAPVGDYGEWLCVEAFGGHLAPNSQKSFDLETADGIRLQVKTRLVAERIRASDRQLSALRSWDFDYLAVVLLNRSDYTVRSCTLIPTDIARENATRDPHQNSYTLHATAKLLEDPAVLDKTDVLTAAQSCS